VQGVAALKQLALDISGDSISSSLHYSFHSSGHVIGCYGRALGPLSSEGSITAASSAAHDVAAAHHHQPKRQHRIIGRQRLRRLMLERLLPHTVPAASLSLLICPSRAVPSGEMGCVRVQLPGAAAGCSASAPERRLHRHCIVCVTLAYVAAAVPTFVCVAGLVAADGIWSAVARQKLQHTGAMWSRPTNSASGDGDNSSRVGQGESPSERNAIGGGMQYLGVMIVLGICRSSSLLHFPVTDGTTVFQTMDGSTRM
jgi:hypothetical protein